MASAHGWQPKLDAASLIVAVRAAVNACRRNRFCRLAGSMSSDAVDSGSVEPSASSVERLPRLKRRADFLRVARGRKTQTEGLILQARARADVPPDQTAPRIGFTVTRKVGNAVMRNRVKRRLRAVADLLLPSLARAGYDYVLIGRSTTVNRPFHALCSDLEQALRKVHAPRTGRMPGRKSRQQTGRS